VTDRPENEQVKEPTAVIRRPPGPAPADGPPRPSGRMERIALVDLLDRLLAGGVVVSGEVTLSIADVDMVTVSLRALVTSVSALARESTPERPGR
jgi:Gas vesicle protein